MVAMWEQSLLYGETIVKFLAAFLFGGIIGWERETKNKPVGIKTCIIISVASCLLTQVSIQSAEHYAELSMNIRTDPMRLAAQIISGVGFLGAGVILHRRDDGISGLTTAAIVWASAGIGIASGAGFYLHAAFGTLLFLAAIRISPFLAQLKHNDGNIYRASVRLVLLEGCTVPTVLERIREKQCSIDTLNIVDTKKQKVVMNMRISTRKKTTVYDLYTSLKEIEGVYSVSLDR